MKKIIAFGVAFAPFIVSAQTIPTALGGVANADLLVLFTKNALLTAGALILAGAVIVFLWGVFQFVMSAGDDEARAKGRSHIIWGIIGIAVMVSVWGLVNFFTSSAALTGGTGTAPALSF